MTAITFVASLLGFELKKKSVRFADEVDETDTAQRVKESEAKETNEVKEEV